MLKKMIEKIEEMAKPEMLNFDGREYTSKPIYPVKEPTPGLIGDVHTLTGLVDYLRCNIDNLEFDSLMIHVQSPVQVNLCSSLYGGFMTRAHYLSARADVPGIPFGKYQPVEPFIIMLQSMFHATPDRENILRIAGNLKDSAVKTVSDDGISQQVTVKRGISTVGEEVLPNPVALCPFRTFMEIEQPESAFIFRMKSDPDGGLPLCCLHEADGGSWRLDAIQGIRGWLQGQVGTKTGALSAGLAIIA